MISLESQIENINDPSTLKILLRKLINDPSSLLPTLNANKPIKKQEQSYIDHIEEEHEQTLIELDEITNQLSSLKEVYSTTNQQITTLKADVLSLKEMNQTYSIELNLLAQEKKQWSRERTELTMKLNSIPSNTQSTDTNLTIQLNKKVTDLTLQLNQLTQQIKSQSNELRIVNESLTQSQSKLEEHEDSSLKLKELQSTHDEAQEYIQLLEQQLQSQTTPLNNTFATKSLLGISCI